MSRRDHQAVFLTSLNDLMTSLAVVFILLLVVYASNAQANTTKLQKLIDQLKSSTKGTFTTKELIKNKLNQQGLAFSNDEVDPLALIYSAPEDKLLFDSGEAKLQHSGEDFLSRFIPQVMSVISADDVAPNVESILIEGHTDSKGDEDKNLELSQKRALAVLLYALNRCNITTVQRDVLLNDTSINGRGQRCLLPLGSKPGQEDMAASRRVVFKIRVKSLEQKIQRAKEATSGMH